MGRKNKVKPIANKESTYPTSFQSEFAEQIGLRTNFSCCVGPDVLQQGFSGQNQSQPKLLALIEVPPGSSPPQQARFCGTRTGQKIPSTLTEQLSGPGQKPDSRGIEQESPNFDGSPSFDEAEIKPTASYSPRLRPTDSYSSRLNPVGSYPPSEGPPAYYGPGLLAPSSFESEQPPAPFILVQVPSNFFGPGRGFNGPNQAPTGPFVLVPLPPGSFGQVKQNSQQKASQFEPSREQQPVNQQDFYQQNNAQQQNFSSQINGDNENLQSPPIAQGYVMPDLAQQGNPMLYELRPMQTSYHDLHQQTVGTQQAEEYERQSSPQQGDFQSPVCSCEPCLCFRGGCQHHMGCQLEYYQRKGCHGRRCCHL